MPASSVALCRTVARVLRTSETSRERKGGLQPLDVGGVDHRRGTALRGLRGSEPLSHLSLRAANDAPKDPNHPSAGVPLNRLGDHDPLRQKKSRPSSLAGANRLTQYLERLLRVAREPVGAEQQALGCSTSAHTKKERPDQMPPSRRTCTTPPSHSRLLTESADASHTTLPTMRMRNSSA